MVSKGILSVIMLTVIALSGWQVYGLLSGNHPEVLSATTSSEKPKTLEERVLSLEARVLMLEKFTGAAKSKTTVTSVKEFFKQLTAGRVSSPEWTKIDGSDFSFDYSLYGTNIEATWQGWVENGPGSFRIYDDTNKRVVDNSELTVGDAKSSFYSKPLSIWRGQNQYHIELKSVGGSLNLLESTLRILVKY